MRVNGWDRVNVTVFASRPRLATPTITTAATKKNILLNSGEFKYIYRTKNNFVLCCQRLYVTVIRRKCFTMRVGNRDNNDGIGR